jgi:type IV fimbrial biogenesis protein FimT
MSSHCSTNAGFTLIELMITIAIVAILITVGVPSMTEFAAQQRVRTAASDLAGDMALARAEAIKESRRAILERIDGATGTWKDGWRICVDLDGNGSCSAAEDRKRTTPLGGRIEVCASNSDFDRRISFRPDGRILPPGTPTANDGIKISDALGDSDYKNDKIRLLVLGVSGRALMINNDSDPRVAAKDTPCPAT